MKGGIDNEIMITTDEEAARGRKRRLRLTRSEAGVVERALEEWRAQGLVDEILCDTLRDQLDVTDDAAEFDWSKLTKYLFWMAIACFVIAIVALISDRFIQELFWFLFQAPAIIKLVRSAGLAALTFNYAHHRRQRQPESKYSNEAIVVVAVLFISDAVFHLEAFVPADYSVPLFVASIIYGVLGYQSKSNLVWTFALVSLGAWLGATTGYISGRGTYFLGMNYPLRFVFFGFGLAAIALKFEKDVRFEYFSHSTLVMGLLYLFIALWILSIAGNYGSKFDRRSTPPSSYELLPWALLFACAAILSTLHGLRTSNSVTKGFGLTFLFLNLYTRFFEYFWGTLHKGVFFLLLALSFSVLGVQAERIWNLNGRQVGAVVSG